MSSRINNMPIGIVYDRSFLQNVTSTATSGTITHTNTINYMIDDNLTTYYETIVTGVSDVGNQELIVKFDYQKVFYNCQVMYKVLCTNTTALSWVIQTSDDNSTWTVIKSLTPTATADETKPISHARYVRVFAYTSGLGSITNTTLKIYEMRLMGSGQ